ncbi:GDSL-type esterase/lipase family protein [Streptomyces sp. NPDC002668]|uniref:GDSL-type esterase/lipase family protein n=1 Tax=Streptomyces sp. NPDC002668 TaxID=3154422 RepID=UPI003325FBBD
MADRPLSLVREENDPYCLREDEPGTLLAPSRWRRLVVLGDGRTERRAEHVDGYGQEPWYDRVADALRAVHPGLAYLNLLGRREQQAADVRSRQLPEALAFNGDLAVVHLAGHDLLHSAFDTSALGTEIVRIVAPLRESGYDVMLVEPFDLTQSPCVPPQHEAALRTRQRLQTARSHTLALRHGALHVDLSACLPEAAASFWAGDRITPNGRGHAVAAATVVRALGVHLRAGRVAGRPAFPAVGEGTG